MLVKAFLALAMVGLGCCTRHIPNLYLNSSHSTALLGVANEVHVIVGIDTKHIRNQEKRTHAPLDIVVVLDHSGSMHGAPLESCKTAIVGIIEELREGDFLSLVVYDSNVHTVFDRQTIANKDKLIELTNDVHSGTATNIYGGLQAAQTILQQGHTDLRAHLKRLFFFSDGMANEGITDGPSILGLVQQLKAADVTTSAFGVGNNFDEQLMKDIAGAGGAGYFYLDGPDSIELGVSVAVKGVTNLLATDAVLTVKGVNGCTVTAVKGYSSPGEWTNGVPIGDIKVNNHKKLLVQLVITPSVGVVAGGTLQVMEAELTYRYKLVENENDNTETVTTQLSIGFTDKQEEVKEEPAVLEYVQLQNLLKHFQEAEELMRQGQHAEASAIFSSHTPTLTAMPSSREVKLMRRRYSTVQSSLTATNYEQGIRKLSMSNTLTEEDEEDHDEL